MYFWLNYKIKDIQNNNTGRTLFKKNQTIMHVDWLICQSKMGLRMFNLKRKEFKKSANFHLATTQFNCLYLKGFIINIKELFGLKYLHSCSQKYPRISHSFYCLADKQIILVESALCRFVLSHFRYSLILNMHPYRKT